MTKYFENMETTDSPKVYAKARKRVLSKETGMCPLCPYHRKENSPRFPAHVSWKNSTKRRKQYKPI